MERTEDPTGLKAPACKASRIRIQGFEAVRLDNGFVQADVIPELGGRVWNLRHMPSKTQWLWHRPKKKIEVPKPGAAFDDAWMGGWEELFPNDAPGKFEGRVLPDHGEWWSRPWEWEIQEQSEYRVVLQLWHDGAETPTRCQKWIVLEAGVPEVKVRYRILHLGVGTLHFMLKEHLALAVTPDHRIELPGGEVTPVDLKFSTRIGRPGSYVWPVAEGKSGKPVDLSVLPGRKEKQREFVYVYDMPEGWCGVRDRRTGRFIRLRFPKKIFPFVWIFMTFGGWKGLYTVVLEPCTNMPKDLGEALRSGRCAGLGSEEALEAEISAELG